MNTDPFPPKIIIEHHDGQQTFCALKDVVDGVPRYELPCPDCGGTGVIYSNPEEGPIIQACPNRQCVPKAQPTTRLEADTARAFDLIGRAFGS